MYNAFQTIDDIIRHKSVCINKSQYRDKVSAKHAAKKVKSGVGLVLRPYRCSFCKQFHLQSVQKKQDKLERYRNSGL